jgi:hypothetical protein
MGAAPLTGDAPSDVVSGDFDKNGTIDLATANKGGRSVSVLRAQTGGGFLRSDVALSVNSSPVQIVAGDWDVDADVDLFTANDESGGQGSLFQLVNGGAGNFTVGTMLRYNVWSGSNLAPILALAAIDVQADGRPDLVTAFRSGNQVIVFWNTYSGFNEYSSSVVTVPYYGTAMTVWNPDLDSNAEMIFAHQGYPSGIAKVELFELYPNGFSAGYTSLSQGLGCLATGDLDRDGTTDIVGGVRNTDRISVLRNQGSLAFCETSLTLGTDGTDIRDIAVEDLDADGDLDIVVATGVTGRIYVLGNAGDGTFPPGLRGSTPGGASPNALDVKSAAPGDLPSIHVVRESIDSAGVIENGGCLCE